MSVLFDQSMNIAILLEMKMLDQILYNPVQMLSYIQSNLENLQISSPSYRIQTKYLKL